MSHTTQCIHRLTHVLPAAHLDSQGSDDVLGVHQVGVAQVVQPIRLEDLTASLEPHGSLRGEGHAVLGQELRGNDTQSTCRAFPNF